MFFFYSKKKSDVYLLYRMARCVIFVCGNSRPIPCTECEPNVVWRVITPRPGMTWGPNFHMLFTQVARRHIHGRVVRPQLRQSWSTCKFSMICLHLSHDRGDQTWPWSIFRSLRNECCTGVPSRCARALVVFCYRWEKIRAWGLYRISSREKMNNNVVKILVAQSK